MSFTVKLNRMLGCKRLGVAAVFSALLLSSCTVRGLSPAGPATQRISEIWWLMLSISGAIFVVVVAALIFALFRRRESDVEVSARHDGKALILWAGVVIPVITVIALMAFNVDALVDVTDPLNEAELVIEVTGQRWWWDVEYPDYDITTANEIYIPVGMPVSIQLSSDDVIHSFWVPELHGKRDLMPGITVPYWIQADRPGVYEGHCAEFCGLQHAKMLIRVIALEQAEFDTWLESEQEDAREPQTDLEQRGQDIFLQTACAGCHTISGTAGEGTAGPNLSHFGSRQTIGAGILPNTPENLAAWVVNAQQFKPGAQMPPQPMPDEDVEALVTYLLSLE